MAKSPKPLDAKQLRTILVTADDDLQRVFPGYDRGFLRAEKRRAAKELDSDVLLEMDTRGLVQTNKAREYERLYKAALHKNEYLQKMLELASSMPAIEKRSLAIQSKDKKHKEATAVLVASDWHCEEEVRSEQVNGLNAYSLDIFDQRARWFFKNAISLVDKEAKAVPIHNMIFAILGDMISGNIHGDIEASVALGPMDAISLVMDTLASGIRQMLKETPKEFTFTIPVVPGNHSRITKEQRWQSEHENALEWLMGLSLAREFKNEPRVAFVCQRSQLVYVNVAGMDLRFLHGHTIRYGGGVGGITIPAAKKINEWDKGRMAYRTFFGHHHTYFDGPNFSSNGSMIGTTAYSVSQGFHIEPPRQAFCLIDHRHGLTARLPVLLEQP